MPKPKRPKSWPVKDVRYVEVSLADLTTRHLHVEFDHGIRIAVSNEGQLSLERQKGSVRERQKGSVREL